MKNFRSFFAGLTVLSVSVFSLVSCDNDNDLPLNALVDVSIHDMKVDGAVKYGVFIYAQASEEIKTVKVTAPGTGGKVYELTVQPNKIQALYIPQASEYTAELPVKGDYTFEVVSSSNEKVTGVDAVGEEKLPAITIKSAAMNNHSLKTTWDKITGADAYAVRLYSENKSELLFASTAISSNDAEFEFSSTTSGWASGKSPVANTNYVVELVGVKYETGATVDKGNNVQFVTLDSKTIKWE
jgi:hypothetical protein